VSTVTHHHYPPSPISGPALIVHLAPVVLHGSRTERRVSVVLKRNIFVVALSLSAVLSGPLLVPFFLNTDPVTVLHARLDESESISGWYGPGAWVAYVLTVLAALAHILKLAWHVKTVHLWTWSSLACKDCPCVDKWDGDLLVAFVYTLFSVYDLIHRSVPVIHAHSMPYLELKNVPALQAAATSSYVGFGASYVLIIGFSMLLWSTWQGSFLDVMKAHRRRAIILGAMFVVAHVGVSICEHARLTFLARDTSVSPIFLPSRLTSGSVSVFGVVSDNLAPSAWIKILSIFYTLMGPAGALVIYGITVCIFLLLQSVRSSTITWRQAGATLIFAYVWPFCMFIVVMYLIILVSRSSNFFIDVLHMGILSQPVYFVIALWPSIWLAFTPGSGLFPCSNISVMELDQLGTLTTLVAAMAIRLFSYLNQVVKAHLVAHSDLETRSSSVSV
jgi:hypothetical protein